ncbi:hypothetical protein MMC17_002132 [Xylographa soralifera]|nr:hypothetical protein [Xylographa soralifera]
MAAQQHKEEQPTAMKVAVLPCGAGDNAINPIYVLKELHKLAIRIDLNLAKLANTGTRRYTLALIGNGEKPCPREYVAVLNSLDFWLRGFATTTDYLCHTRPELSPAQIRELKAWIQRSVLTIVAFRRAYPLKKMDRVLFEASQYGIVPIESMVAADPADCE